MGAKPLPIPEQIKKLLFGDEILKRIFAGASASLSIRVSGIFVMFFAHALLVRTMGDHNYGIYAYAISVIPILALIANSGFQISGLRFLHEYNKSEKLALKAGYIKRSFQIPLLMSSIIFLTATGAGFYFDGLPKPIAESAKYASWILVFFSLTYIAQQQLRAMKKIVFSQIFEQIGLPMVLILLAAYYFFTKNTLDYQTVFILHGMAYFLTLCVCWILVMKFAGVGLKSNRQYDTINWIKVSLPLGLVGTGLVFMTRMDIMILGIFVSAEEITLYSVSSRIAGLAVFCMAALSVIMGPYISEFHHNQKTRELTVILRKVVRIAIVINLSFWIFLLVFGHFLLLAFGEQFIPYKSMMLILAAGRLSGIGVALVGPILTVSGHQKEYMYFLILMSLILFTALYYSVENFGLMGAAVATTSVMVIANISLFFLVNRCVGINVFERH